MNHHSEFSCVCDIAQERGRGGGRGNGREGGRRVRDFLCVYKIIRLSFMPAMTFSSGGGGRGIMQGLGWGGEKMQRRTGGVWGRGKEEGGGEF